jgi:hypothetical protein
MLANQKNDQSECSADISSNSIMGAINLQRLFFNLSKIFSQQLVKKLPKNSPFRQPLLKQLSKEVDPQGFKEFFGVSDTVYKRILKQEKSSFL